jgi:hypothetical protein
MNTFEFFYIVMMLIFILGFVIAIWFNQITEGMTPIPDTYEECIASDLPEHICEILYPPLNRQSV